MPLRTEYACNGCLKFYPTCEESDKCEVQHHVDTLNALAEQEDKPQVSDVVPLCMNYYALPGNGAGGNLHIVLDDGNVRDSDIEFCIERAQEKGDKFGEAIGRVLLRMSKTQRRKVYRTG